MAELMKKSKKRFSKMGILAILLFVFTIAFFLSIANGVLDLSPREIIRILLLKENFTHFQIIWNIRMPRTLVAALVGISLSLSGVILQGIMRNSLAGPNIIGVSSGAGFLGLLILIVFPDYYYLLPLASFSGALLATLIVYSLAWRQGGQPSRLILAGVAVSSIFSAGSNTLMTFYPEKVSGAIGFMVGGLSSISWLDFKMILPYASLGILAAFLLPNRLNVLGLGDDIARGLGLDVEKTRFLFIILSSLLAGAAVSVVGLLGFVGLIVPHMARLLIGSDYRYLFPASMLLGGSTLMLADTLARTIFAPMEIPVGIIMAVVGGPFFLYILNRKEGI